MNGRGCADALSREREGWWRCVVAHSSRVTDGTGNDRESQQAGCGCAERLAGKAWQTSEPGRSGRIRVEGDARLRQAIEDAPFKTGIGRGRADAPQRGINAGIIRGVMHRFAVHR
jgi:hypothetical protein